MFRGAFPIGSLLIALMMGVWSPRSNAQTSVTLNPSKDNTLYEAPTGALSNGAGEYLFVGKTAGALIRRGLLAFDVAGSVPAGATIDSVRLTLNFSRTTAAPQEVELHRVLADWGEGTSDAGGEEGGGALSTTDDATWIHTFWNTVFWADSGGDFSSTVSASQIIGDDTEYGRYEWGSTPQMVTDVQSWLDDPSSNFGWILTGNEDENRTAKRFDSRENAVPANRPALTIHYTQVGVPCSVITSWVARCAPNGNVQARVRASGDWTGEEVTISIDGVPHVVTAQVKQDMTASQWKYQEAGTPGATHIVSLNNPSDCQADFMVTCPSDQPGDWEWEDDESWGYDLADGSANPATEAPATTQILRNYPNPFNPSTTIYYDLGRDSRVSVKIFNAIGQEITTLVNDFQPAGRKSVVWNGKSASGNDVAAGVYIILLRTPDVVKVDKVLLLK